MRVNREENLVAQLFSNQGYKVDKEPDGNIPPDLVLDNQIAIEVTRLSEVINIGDHQRSVSDDASSIIARLKYAINTPENDVSQRYKVSAVIKRPFGNLKNISKKIKNELQDFNIDKFVKNQYKVVISQSVRITISKCTGQYCNGFLLVDIIDSDSSHESNDIILNSVLFCLESKEKKVLPYYKKYFEWWLVLSDTITYDSMHNYKNHLENHLPKSIFSRILFVNSISGELVTEI